ncbi:MAG TPA: cation diffusion facilitator family transporter [Bryobacteraceae bacterium]|nr:cation diffusion facilitator family transporter [Bryobacteraceae bacterium]
MNRPEQTARRAALAGIAISIALSSVKIAVGLAAHSVALVSDGFESAADILMSGLVLFGLWIAAKPADDEHPYGHGRFEILTGLAIGAILTSAGVGISWRAIANRYDRAPEAFALWPLLGATALKASMWFAKRRIARRSGSTALNADAWNDAVDMCSGIVALIAVALAVFVPGMHAADHWGGFVVGLFVVFFGLRVVRETALQLMDTMPEGEQMQEIRAVALRVPGALGIEKCFARKTGLRYHVDLHLEVDPDLTVRASHDIATAVRDALRRDVDWVEDVLVHVEPHAQAPTDATIKQ